MTEHQKAPFQLEPGICPRGHGALTIVRIYNDGRTFYGCEKCQHEDKEAWAQARKKLP